MTNTNQAGNAAYAAGIDGGAPTTALSVEGLLMYCSSRLESLDTTIKQYFTEQQDRNAGIRDAAKLIAMLKEGSWNTGQKGGMEIVCNEGHLQNHANKANEILALWRSTSSPEVKKACETAFRTVSGLDINAYGDPSTSVDTIALRGAVTSIPAVDPAGAATQIDAIKDVQASLSKSAEMNMIQLQSLVSQRQLAVQMTTQLLQVVHEGLKGIAANFRS
ncbi:MAG TPA: hypothetical protein VM925_34510 [Labilithrix sp.]|nr:hypothetical protein [Labilithrix sp.]